MRCVCGRKGAAWGGGARAAVAAPALSLTPPSVPHDEATWLWTRDREVPGSSPGGGHK